MVSYIEEFRQELLAFGVVDPEGTHHEFNQGLHGVKVDLDIDKDRDTALFAEWVDTTAGYIRENYEQIPDALVGVASGTNELAKAVAKKLGGGVLYLATEKLERSKPVLSDEAKLLVEEFKPVFALIIEDVGNLGTNSLAAARETLKLGVPKVEVLNTWQRSETLVLLDEAGIAYKSIIKQVFDNFTPEECRERGFCARGWKLIKYGA